MWPWIVRLSSSLSKASGGDEIIMLCDKVVGDDIRIRFFETNDNSDEIWEADGIFVPQDVYKQMAIGFRTPLYHNTDIQDSAVVGIY